MLHEGIQDYLQAHAAEVMAEHDVDNLAMAMSLVAATRGPALTPEYANNLPLCSVVRRLLECVVPTVDLVVGYSRANTSPMLSPFLSRLDELVLAADSRGQTRRAREKLRA